MKADDIDAADCERIVRLFQPLMLLSDWRIEVKDGETSKEERAEAYINGGAKSLLIRVFSDCEAGRNEIMVPVEETILHEMLHGVLNDFCESRELKEDDEDWLCDRFAAILYRVWRNADRLTAQSE